MSNKPFSHKAEVKLAGVRKREKKEVIRYTIELRDPDNFPDDEMFLEIVVELPMDTFEFEVTGELKDTPFEGFASGEEADRVAQVYGSNILGWLVEDGADIDDISLLATRGGRRMADNKALGQWIESLSEEELQQIRKLLGLKPRSA